LELLERGPAEVGHGDQRDPAVLGVAPALDPGPLLEAPDEQGHRRLREALELGEPGSATPRASASRRRAGTPPTSATSTGTRRPMLSPRTSTWTTRASSG
jgi:hypothetical protein